MAGDEKHSAGESYSVSARNKNENYERTASASASTTNINSSSSSPKLTGKRKRRRQSKKARDPLDPISSTGLSSNSFELLNSVSVNPDTGNVFHPQTASSLAGFAENPVRTETGPIVVPEDAGHNYGQNRLAGGFVRAQMSHNTASAEPGEQQRSTSNPTSVGLSKIDAIEITDSDDDMDDSEGGMVVNLASSPESGQIEDEDMGSASENVGLPHQLAGELDDTAMTAESKQSHPAQVRLADLNPDDLEDQLRYAFYHLDRSQIDLTRPAICLSCMQEGHLSFDCPESSCSLCDTVGQHPKHLCPIAARCAVCRSTEHIEANCDTRLKGHRMSCKLCGDSGHTEEGCSLRFFPQPRYTSVGPTRLWISCCLCASKSHLVGDCPDADQPAAARWSLKALDPSRILNLSLQSGTRNIEREAEARGMRPPGLLIKGRADLHHAGGSGRDDASDDSDEPFLKSSVRSQANKQRPHITMGAYRTQNFDSNTNRYDRFAAPTYDRGHATRKREGWYGTDSFGRRRSRSPEDRSITDSWRPISKQSTSPRGTDSYRPNVGRPPSEYWQQQSENSTFAQPSSADHISTRQQHRHHHPSHDHQLSSSTRKSSNPTFPRNPIRPAVQPEGRGSRFKGPGGKGKTLKSTRPKLT